jgi:hypothetical protein
LEKSKLGSIVEVLYYCSTAMFYQSSLNSLTNSSKQTKPIYIAEKTIKSYKNALFTVKGGAMKCHSDSPFKTGMACNHWH